MVQCIFRQIVSKTKFEPPKKIKKDSKGLSGNTKKFLDRKEAEEQKKTEDARINKETLLEQRSQNQHADQNKVHSDPNDYGCVSQESSVFYEKNMKKYSKLRVELKFYFFIKKLRKPRNRPDNSRKNCKDKPKPTPPPMSFQGFSNILKKPMQKANVKMEKPNKNGIETIANISRLPKHPGSGQNVSKHTRSAYRDETDVKKNLQTKQPSNLTLLNNKNIDQRNSSVNKNSSREDALAKSVSVKKCILTEKVASGKLQGKTKEFPPRIFYLKVHLKMLDLESFHHQMFETLRGKRRIMNDSNEKYDSELDDLIDDGFEEEYN
ncbi:hypothetical protein GWI33_008166 [Rhynchophorus ferrugineus]|nr:hypothetical protein GWI33_008166 [Rhynchophorus ferrugineus]